MNKLNVAIVGLMIFLSSNCKLLGQSSECAQLAPYLWDTEINVENKRANTSFMEFLCASRSSYSSSSGGTSVGLGIPNLPLLSFGSSHGGANSVQSQFCHSKNAASDFMSVVESYRRSVSPVVAGLIEKCFATRGFHVAAFQGATPRIIRIKLGFVPFGKPTSVKGKISVLPRGGVNASCEAPFEVDSAGKTILCERLTGAGLTFAINADFLPDHDSFDVPPIPQGKPPIVIEIDRSDDEVGVVGNKLDGFKTAYMSRKDEVGGMWTADGGGPYHVGWRVKPPEAGRYLLIVKYAAEESRPTEVHLDEQTLFVALSHTTGSWADAEWFTEGTIDLHEGINRLWFHRNQPPPNIDAVRLIKVESE